jgi:hypothetical protein
LAVGNQFAKAFDSEGNYIPDEPSNKGNTAIAGAGVAGGALGMQKLKVASTLQHTAPTTAANAAAVSAKSQADEIARNSEKAMANAKLSSAKAGRKIPFVRGSRIRSANKEVRSTTMAAARQSKITSNAAAEAARTANVASHASEAQRALSHHGLGLIAGGAALTATALRSKKSS